MTPNGVKCLFFHDNYARHVQQHSKQKKLQPSGFTQLLLAGEICCNVAAAAAIAIAILQQQQQYCSINALSAGSHAASMFSGQFSGLQQPLNKHETYPVL